MNMPELSAGLDDLTILHANDAMAESGGMRIVRHHHDGDVKLVLQSLEQG
jgi:hypothetical protein